LHYGTGSEYEDKVVFMATFSWKGDYCANIVGLSVSDI